VHGPTIALIVCSPSTPRAQSGPHGLPSIRLVTTFRGCTCSKADLATADYSNMCWEGGDRDSGQSATQAGATRTARQRPECATLSWFLLGRREIHPFKVTK